MEIELRIKLEVDITGKIITAPVFIDLYPMGYVQAGKAREGFRKWELKRENRCPCCGRNRE